MFWTKCVTRQAGTAPHPRTRTLITATLAALAGLLVSTTAAPPAAAQTTGYTVTDLGLLSGATDSNAYAVNGSGLVVGRMTFPIDRSTTRYKGWLWTPSAPNPSSGSPRALQPLEKWPNSRADDVNNAGLIVGSSFSSAPGTAGNSDAATFWPGSGYAPADFNNLPRDPALTGWTFTNAYSVSDPAAGTGDIFVMGRGIFVDAAGSTSKARIVWHVDAAGVIVSVTTLDGWNPSPLDALAFGEMNNHGQVTNYVTKAGGSDAFLWDIFSGGGTNLGTLGGTNAYGLGINDYGAVVGWSYTAAGTSREFVWTPSEHYGTQGTMVALGTLGGTYSRAKGINDLNQIVGNAYTSRDQKALACLWQNRATTPTDLNTLKKAGATGLILVDAFRINNRGGIIGAYTGSKGARSFLLTPTN